MLFSRKLRIGYFADGPWSHKAFNLLVNDKALEIVFIVPRKDTQDFTLKNYAEKSEIDYLSSVSISSPEFYKYAEAYDCDLFVSMSFNQIFREPLISLPKHNTINCHAGKLPFYRGRNILNWVIINDEKEFGITVHFVDEGIDTGDIILQRTYPIKDSDDYGTLLEVAYEECAKILYDAVKDIQSGSFNRIDQSTIHPVGFYCGRRVIGDEVINWDQSSRKVFNFIRALSKPGPIATSAFKGELVTINKARIIADAPSYVNKPGQLLSKTKEGFIVKTRDSFIEIFGISSKNTLKVGDKLGT